MTQIYLGVDVGASGIKGALVNIETGELASERLRLETPEKSTPTAMAELFRQMTENFDYKGRVGVGFPSVVKNNKALTAANLDKSWIGTDIADTFSSVSGCEVFALNDADAAGAAEMAFGIGKGEQGTVVLVTIGTGLGTAIFLDGKLLPNSELGHFHLPNGKHAETYAANSAKKREGLSWKEWGNRFNEYLERLELFLQPDLIILGGGSSKKFEEYKDCLKIDTPIKSAHLRNHAGIIGAAVYAARK